MIVLVVVTVKFGLRIVPQSLPEGDPEAEEKERSGEDHERADEGAAAFPTAAGPRLDHDR